MKTQNRVSQLTLELYHRGLATRKERKQVEKALLADSAVRERYEALKDSEREINQLVTKELARLNMPESPPVQAVHSVSIVWVIAAAAILICVLVPVFLYLRSHSPNKENVIAEDTARETELSDTIITEDIPTEDIPIENKALEQPARRERGGSNTKPAIAETPRRDPASPSTDLQSGKTEIAAIPTPDTAGRFRGGNNEQQSDAVAPSGQEADTGIPPGITFIFENMFANRFMVGIVIPDRIRSIAKNAYAGNPVVVVTIGANVNVHDEAIPGNFAKAYNSYGRQAGVYRRPDSDSEAWEKQ